jgi:hypothetical protein
MPGSLSLFSVNAVLLMSADDGSRIFAKYYSPPHPPAGTAPNSTDYPGANPYPTLKEQKAFEQGLLEKTNKQTSDVILYDNRIVVFKMESDVMLYVVGSADENEVLLYNVVLSLRDALGILFKYVLLVLVFVFTPSPLVIRVVGRANVLFFFFVLGALLISGRLSRTTISLLWLLMRLSMMVLS